MRFTFTDNPRLSEPAGFVLLAVAIGAVLSLVSYDPLDPAFNVAAGEGAARNLTGLPGAYFADAVLQTVGLAGFLIPIFLTWIGWTWLRSSPWPWPGARLAGALLLLVAACSTLSLTAGSALWRGAVKPGGALGTVLAESLVRYLNQAGAGLALLTLGVVSLYLLTNFELGQARNWAAKRAKAGTLSGWLPRVNLHLPRLLSGRKKAKKKSEATTDAADELELPVRRKAEDADADPGSAEPPPIVPYHDGDPVAVADEDPVPKFERDEPTLRDDEPPWDDEAGAEEELEPEIDYRVPTASLLHPPMGRAEYDPAELHEVARRISEKFDEFKVGGDVTQINPGPVVTTFEFKPNPGVKYSKIINLSEDLCLALECESILVERIPGKSTVGIEVPNSKREIISLREIIESRDFREADSSLTVAMGKDINGRLQTADLASMPHLLVAGSTGSGKSVMINTFIMSILMRATPNEVRFIMVDPKTVELGLYRDIPHLLTPVITDMKKASNALKNATVEMERRLKLLAEHSVRNIDQFNKKIDRLKQKYALEGADDLSRSLRRLPYIVIIIDELADLMILEGRQIEESITRLAQMARAVGIHLVLATQRPSVDVITGLIKANIPARLSFRLATRIDSRTILDSMGAEALLGRGDMLYLPPGTARMMRIHGPLVTEEEIEAVVTQWKQQAKPRYENGYLAAPPGEQEDSDDGDTFDDPMFEDAVRVVLEAGKASTSTLQRRLRIGYGRAARILDAMEKDGIISAPDGSRPREILKRPDWLGEIDRAAEA